MHPLHTQQQRYAKFRKLGQFEEWVVRGADWRNTRASRSAAPGVQTAAGTWAVSEAEAAHIEASVNSDEAWDRAMGSKGDWTNKPVQPPGLGRCVGARGCCSSGVGVGVCGGSRHASLSRSHHHGCVK
jgi:acetyl-CoA carboxylase carboxyl transferase subunit alpha